MLPSCQSEPTARSLVRSSAPQALAARREREEQVSKAQMEAALSGGASWGFGEDAFDEEGNRERGPEGEPGRGRA